MKPAEMLVFLFNRIWCELNRRSEYCLAKCNTAKQNPDASGLRWSSEKILSQSFNKKYLVLKEIKLYICILNQKTMVSIKINEEVKSVLEVPELLRKIAGDIEDGFTSGHYPHWELVNVSDRDEKIRRIQEIISEWGQVTSGELELESSPCVNSNGGVVQLIEKFEFKGVDVYTYHNDIEINSDFVPYNELSDDILDEVSDILEQYDVEQEKLFNSIKGEDF
jgi:hypothetical protein